MISLIKILSNITIKKKPFVCLIVIQSFILCMAINATAQNIENNASFTEEELTWIAEHPVLKATNEMDWAPIDFVRSGEPAGFSIDYLNLIASKAGFSMSMDTHGQSLLAF